jgi:natural product biosynthesis luciferase-like monooxygenase protein
MSGTATTRQPLEFSVFFFSADAKTASGPKYRLMLETAKFCDDNGFTAVWTPERHFAAFGGLYPNPAITGAALAMATKRLKIRAGSVVLPLQNPLRVAEEWAVLDNLSEGRVGVAFASGWHVNDFVLAPASYANRREDMFHKLSIVQQLWRGEKLRLANGAGNEVEVEVLPRPIQPELPTWLTCQADETFAKAGELGHSVLTNFNFKKFAELERKIRIYRDSIQTQHGRWGHLTLMVHAYVGEDEKSVLETAVPVLNAYLHENLAVQQTNLNLGKQTSAGGTGDDDEVRLTDEDRQFLVQRATTQFVSESGFIGTKETCCENASRLYAAGVDELACLIDFGVPLDETLQSLRRIAEVSIRLRGARS